MRKPLLFALLLAVPSVPALAQLVPEGPEFVVASACPAYGRPRAAMNGSGEFIVAWHSEELAPPGTPILAWRFSRDGSPLGDVIQVSGTYPGDENYKLRDASPKVAMDGLGGFTAIWHSRELNQLPERIIGRSFDPSGFPLSDDLPIGDSNAAPDNLDMSMSGAGEFVVVWNEYNPPPGQIRLIGRRFSSISQPLGPEFVIADYGARPAVAMDSLGNFSVVWRGLKTAGASTQSPPTQSLSPPFRNAALRGQGFDSSGLPVGGTFEVGDVAASTFDIAVNDSGRLLVTWTEQDCTSRPCDLFGRILDKAGLPLSDVFQVNGGDGLRTGMPSANINARGDFVIAWESAGRISARSFESSGIGQAGDSLVATNWVHFGGMAMDSQDRLVGAWMGDGYCGYAATARRFTASFPCDHDGDGIHDDCNVRITTPADSDIVDCREDSDPPTIEWTPGRFDQFTVRTSSTRDFSSVMKSPAISSTRWQPSPGWWHQLCERSEGSLFFSIQGTDQDLPPADPLHTLSSSVVGVQAQR